MVERLVSAARAVTVHARRAEVREACVAAGADATADLLEAVAGAAAVAVCVYSDAQLLDLALGEDGFLTGMDTGSLLLIHTTGSPATSHTLAEHGAAKHLRIVEAPVSGSAQDIAGGKVTVLLGGDPADVELARHVVSAYGDPVLHLGPLGAAQAAKLLNNALLAAELQLIAEVERIAGEFHVDWTQAAAAIQASSGASQAMGIVQSMGSVHALVEAGGHFLRKDMAAVVEVAGDLGIDLGQLGAVNLHGPLRFTDPSAVAPVSTLEDIEAIKQLKARYFRLLDTKDWDGFADLFTEDCEHVLPTAEPRPPVSTSQYLADLQRTLADATTVHHGHMPEIVLTGPDEATGTWAMFDDVELRSASGEITRLQGYGHYFETYRRCDDGKWRISSKRNVRLRVDTLPPRATTLGPASDRA
ncbi:MAG TPA: nuclear transport factor 2 family protein [Acidimicrobiales bacterium]|nr:nuclear transport factor 2 family protein [Acidimicrobiales bacterium]